MTLEQQMQLFRGARQVVGVYGAAMTNIVFCEQGAQVTVLLPAMMADDFFWEIAAHKKLGYAEIRGAQVSYEGANSWIAGFSMGEQDIRYLEGSSSTAFAAE